MRMGAFRVYLAPVHGQDGVDVGKVAPGGFQRPLIGNDRALNRALLVAKGGYDVRIGHAEILRNPGKSRHFPLGELAT